jgi:hypothetical protein
MKNTLLICLLIAVFAAVGLFVFKLPIQSLLLYGLVAACPLMHLFMMGGGKHKH